MAGEETSAEFEDSPNLTEYAELHGCSCKIGQSDLEGLLAETGLDTDSPDLLFGVGEDAAAQPLGDGRAIVSTIDFFTPIIDDPHAYGEVAACNAASDAFAKGATANLSFLVVLGLPRELTDVAASILEGVIAAVDRMDGVIAGGHSVLNPWPLAGASVTATASVDSLVTTQDATPGETLYLTKPLGTQPAMGALRVMDGEFGDQVRETTHRPIREIGDDALDWMRTPNMAAAKAIQEAPVSAVTDITGFGLVGQSAHLAANAGVGVEITRLPIIEGTAPLSELFGYGLLDGESAETSGGLLIAVDSDGEQALESALEARDVFYRQVGTVTDTREVSLTDPVVEEI